MDSPANDFFHRAPRHGHQRTRRKSLSSRFQLSFWVFNPHLFKGECNSFFASTLFRKIYNIVDDDPAPRAQVFAFARDLIEKKWPNHIKESVFPGSARKAEKRVSNARMKKELGVTLLHPTYRSGLQSIIDNMENPISKSIEWHDIVLSPLVHLKVLEAVILLMNCEMPHIVMIPQEIAHYVERAHEKSRTWALWLQCGTSLSQNSYPWIMGDIWQSLQKVPQEGISQHQDDAMKEPKKMGLTTETA